MKKKPEPGSIGKEGVAGDPQTNPTPDPPPEAGGWDRRTFLGVSLGAVPVIGWAAAGAKVAKPAAAAARGAAPAVAAAVPVTLTVNGAEKRISIDPRTTLLEALREDLAMMGTKEGCDHGQCGACTVLVDGRRVLSCLTLGLSAGGRKITTVEGLAQGDELHPVQAAFLKHDGFQCGYCTPGQIMSAVGLLAEGCPSEPAAIRECMSGNICRCGAYPNIVAAVQEAAAAKGRRA
ncbi:MAG: (2Fe-2S)-binding protein [Acidobacteriota bacterium]|nr:(2Fe-2S)-binding protein [Acidobacteriota bacterium]